MRRKDRERDAAFALEVIDRCEYGVAALYSQEGPYCIPLSLVREGEELYFHCALEGTKLDILRKDPRVCVSFVSDNQAAEEDFTTYFKSAVVMGTAYEITNDEKRIHALRVISQRLTPGAMFDFEGALSRSLGRTGVWGIHIDSITGKEKLKKK